MNQNARPSPLEQLLGLSRQARHAGSLDELAFLAVNDSHTLAPYRQAALWFSDGGVRTLSGVMQIEANAPYVQWLDRACRHLAQTGTEARRIAAADLPPAEAAEWAEWLPAYGLWVPLISDDDPKVHAGLLFARDMPWMDHDPILLAEWADTWHHAWAARNESRRWPLRRKTAGKTGSTTAAGPWWRRGRILIAAATLAVLLFPVHLSVLAPGELVPASPALIRAPIDGTIGQFHVKPNDMVKAGDPLFGFDEAVLASRLAVATQALATAEAEYRQSVQLALYDAKSKAQLAVLAGKIEERRADLDYLRGEYERARVVAPQDGIAIFDDPSEWIGKPVSTGERIMRIAAPGDVEVEAWMPVGDAIPLPAGAPVKLYLNASPLFAVSAQVRYAAHDAVQRPDGSYAYRIRATLDNATDQRVGLKGTARVSGRRVPLIYWMIRRPLAVIRQTVGW